MRLAEAFEGLDHLPEAHEISEWPHDLPFKSNIRTLTFRFLDSFTYQKFIDTEAMEILPNLDQIAKEAGIGRYEDGVVTIQADPKSAH